MAELNDRLNWNVSFETVTGAVSAPSVSAQTPFFRMMRGFLCGLCALMVLITGPCPTSSFSVPLAASLSRSYTANIKSQSQNPSLRNAFLREGTVERQALLKETWDADEKIPERGAGMLRQSFLGAFVFPMFEFIEACPT